MRAECWRASEELEFERAATLRDQIQAIEKVHEGQKVLHLSSETLDLIALATDGDEAWMEVFFVRQGKLVGRDHFIMTGAHDDTPGEILSAFVKQFYEVNPYVPPRILVQDELADTEAISAWLGEKRRSKVPHLRASAGREAASHADGGERMPRRVWSSGGSRRQPRRAALGRAMEELQEALNLPTLPRRMECYDISNTQGHEHPVGSMVVFEEGKPKSSDYRKFQIKAVDGVDGTTR